MLCFLCGKKIGFMRSLFDQQYCCIEHRREARMAAANAFRDEEETESWAVARSKEKNRLARRPQATPGQTASIFAFLTVGGLLVAALMLPGPAAPAKHDVSWDPLVKPGLLDRAGSAIGEIVRSRAPITLHHDFSTGLKDWTTLAMQRTGTVDDPHDWGTSHPQLIAPGSLRLWARSIPLQNYQMEFQGQIEKKSLSWAFRASDSANYYATKVVITRPGPLPNASLVRYVMLGGREFDRVQLPLPVTLERGGNYRVRMSVQDDRFITYLNGQVIGSWTDKRLHRGGIGFFSDSDDEQQVAWVSLSERDSFLGKMLAHFSLFLVPGAPSYVD
jgi:hypothetical protein